MSLVLPTRRLAGLVALLCAFCLSLAGCSGGGQSTPSNTGPAASGGAEGGAWPRTVKTDAGDVTIEKQPQKIVSTSTVLTGALLSVDAPVVASGATGENIPGLSDDQGFFIQWSSVAKEKGVKKLWSNDAPQVEKAAQFQPDLIVVAKAGGDSAFSLVDKLKKIAPVVVIDYGSRSWQDVTTALGQATGHEQQASKVIDDFAKKIEATKQAITVPEGTVSPFIPFGDGSGAAALTPVAPQSEILTSLGFKLAEIPESVKGDDKNMGGDRKDIIALSNENIKPGLPGDTWVVIGALDADKKRIESSSVYATADAVKNKKVFYMPPETFRIDAYSAAIMVDALAKDFAK